MLWSRESVIARLSFDDRREQQDSPSARHYSVCTRKGTLSSTAFWACKRLILLALIDRWDIFELNCWPEVGSKAWSTQASCHMFNGLALPQLLHSCRWRFPWMEPYRYPFPFLTWRGSTKVESRSWRWDNSHHPHNLAELKWNCLFPKRI